MSNNDIAIVRPTTELTIEPSQLGFNDAQLAALTQLGLENVPEGDLKVFFHQAKRSGLDPFAKQIYLIGRNSKNPETDRWEKKYTIQTGIDGFRLNGHRAAKRNGDQIEISAPSWRGREGGWDDVWLDPDHPPAAAKITITVNGHPYPAVAMYHEYVQVKRDGKPNAMWTKMPANQIRKCAEAAAWRMAYPDDFSGLTLEDAAQNTVIDAEPEMQPGPKRGVAGLREKLGVGAPAEPPPAEAESAAEEPAANVDLDNLLDTVALIEDIESLERMWTENSGLLRGGDKRTFSDMVKARKQQLAEQAGPDPS